MHSRPGDASAIIDDFQCDVEPGTDVVLVGRVSGRAQGRRGNLERQMTFQRAEMARLGSRVVAEYRYVGSGTDSSWIIPAVRKARKLGAVIVAACTDRLVRSSFRTDSKHAKKRQANEGELERLSEMANGVKLATLLHPTAGPIESKKFHSLWGQTASGRRGGRPSLSKAETKERKRKLLPTVLALHKLGLSDRAIAANTLLPRSTIRDWIQEWKLTQIRPPDGAVTPGPPPTITPGTETVTDIALSPDYSGAGVG